MASVPRHGPGPIIITNNMREAAEIEYAIQNGY